jgi:threonylcarbamoyladenosine tRNA methylthiotransferase MtaB
VALGADLIAGFPTETAEMFRRSLELITDCGLAFVHVFPFSPRPLTPAARMPQLPATVVTERAARLRAAAAAALSAELASRIGGETDVLVERHGLGRAAFYAAVSCPADITEGTVRCMRVIGSDGRCLIGEPVR